MFIYSPEEVTEVPGEAPTHEVPAMTITLYRDPEGNDLVPPVEGDQPAIEIDGFVPGEPVYTDGIKVFTYIPEEVTEVPGEAPTHEVPAMTITLYRDPDNNDLIPPVEGDQPAIEIDGFVPGEPVYTDGIKVFTYIPEEITEVPGESPTHEVPAMTITLYRDPDGNDLIPPVEGDQPAIEIDGFVTGEPVYTDGIKVFTYIPEEVTEVPGDAPTHEVLAMTITLYRDPDGNDLIPPVEGDGPAIEIDGFVPGEPVYNNGIKIFVYTTATVTEIPNEAPTHDVPENNVTRWITEDGVELTPIEDGTKEVRDFDGYTFESTRTDGPITTHVYHKVVTEIPNEAPTHEVPEMKITRWITEDGVELAVTEEGTWAPRKFDEYTFEGTEHDSSITTHVYHKVVTEIPTEAPTHEIPVMKITRWITEDGEELTPIEDGTQEPREFDGYTFELTRTDGPITTHVYHKVITKVPNEAPKHELPRLEIPNEVPNVELPNVETPTVKQPVTPKVQAPKADKLPETGDSTNILPLIGMSIIGMVGATKRRKKQ